MNSSPKYQTLICEKNGTMKSYDVSVYTGIPIDRCLEFTSGLPENDQASSGSYRLKIS